MGMGVGLGLTFLQVGLVASWGLRAVSEHSSANWSAGLDPSTPKPITWTAQPATATSDGTGTGAVPEPAMTCRGEEDCPPWSRCEPQSGHSSCRCDLGYHLSPTLGCVPVRAFPAQLLLLHLDALGPPEEEEEEEEEARLPRLASGMQHLFQRILGHLAGYLGSSTRDLKWPGAEVTVLHHFSAWMPVTTHEVEGAVAAFRGWCRDSSHASTPACVLLSHVGTYQSLSLCHFGLCDPSSTHCSFQDGLVRCHCRPGYLQAHAADRTCTACSSGFWLRNGTCTRCLFGFSGASCQEPFLLALVAVSCVAGLLLLLLLTSVALSGTLHPQEPSTTPQLPLHSSTLSLPRVRPPWTMQETEGGPLGSRTPLSLWDTDGRPPVAGAPTMKTFLGSPSSLSSAPQPLGGCSNLVFVNDAEEWGK
ncbi:protein HEG-like isoform X2 [Elgaria multicarinata webbii]|uniref:protein HEG-like isoform X2 n=1 Tax=Elgaria multicarinata webbii TaxID=159646 RepID=UPI002FCD10CC